MKNFYKKGTSSVVIVIIILILIAAVFYFWASREKNEKYETNQPPSQPVGFEENPGNLSTPEKPAAPEQPSPAPKEQAQPIKSDVSIKDFGFSPALMTITVGATVTWTNNESDVPHTVTSDMGVFDSGNLNPGKTYSRKFDQAGTFKYHCSYHPNMHGTIVVTQ